MTHPLPPRVAIVTMAHDEALYLPIWLRHHAAILGNPRDCFVIDHGSTDGSTDGLPCSLLRLPPSPHDDARRARAISHICAGLLEWYDWVAFCDTDELLLPDPARFASMAEFCAAQREDTLTAIGLDIQHVPALEAALDPALPIGAQRRFARFTSAMCKPALTRRALDWAPGFHCAAETVPSFGGLFLFHLHWFDRDAGLRRLARTRTLNWADQAAGAHQRLEDAAWLDLFDGMAGLPRREGFDLRRGAAPLEEWLARVRASARQPHAPPWRYGLDINAGELWEIPVLLRARLGPGRRQA